MKQIIAIQNGKDPREVFGAKNDTEGEDDGASVLPQATESELLEYKELLLDELIDIVSQIDAAMDFVKVEGLPMLYGLFNSPHQSLREGAGEVFATVVQNTPFCQEAALRTGAIEKLHLMLSDDHPDCRSKALRCISCM